MGDSPRARSLRQRWALSIASFAALTVALVAVVHGLNSTPGANTDHSADVRANQQGQAVVAADQAPRTAPLPRGAGPRRTLERAIADDVRARLRAQILTGAPGPVRCVAAVAHPRRVLRLAFRCSATAGGFAYPFRGVADAGTRRVVFCKQDDALATTLQVVLDPRCLH